MRILGCRGMRTDGRGQSTHRAWPAFGLLHLVSFVRLGRHPGPGRPAHATDLPHGPHRAISRASRSGVGVVAISPNRVPPRVPCACRGRLVHAAISPAWRSPLVDGGTPTVPHGGRQMHGSDRRRAECAARRARKRAPRCAARPRCSLLAAVFRSPGSTRPHNPPVCVHDGAAASRRGAGSCKR